MDRGETVVVVPGRLGSRRLARKMLEEIGGKPMIVQTALRALEADLGEVLGAVDSVELAECLGDHGIRSVMTDPDLPSGTDRVFAAVRDREVARVINLQGDLPTVPPETIRAAQEALFSDEIAIGTPVALITDPAEVASAHVVKAQVAFRNDEPTARAPSFSRAPVPFGGPYYHHVGIYCYRGWALARMAELAPSALETVERLEQLRAIENGIAIGVRLVPSAPGGVDTADDLARVRAQFAA